MTTSSNITGVRLGRVVLTYVTLTVAVITLSPFRFSLDTINAVSFEWISVDAAMNVIMFVPIGFIYQLSRRRGITAGWTKAFVLGAVLSAVFEAAQMFEVSRHPALADVITNTIGAGFGAALAIKAFGRADPAKAVRAFAVELPLMGVVYMLVPLAWLIVVGSAGNPRVLFVVFLTASAGWIIGAVFTSFERAPLRRVLFVVTVWLLVALAPLALESVKRAAVAAAIGFIACLARSIGPTLSPRETTGADRRFEARTLRVVLPLLTLYVLCSSLTPVLDPRPEWTGFIALFRTARVPTNVEIFRALEHITAFTVIGYAIAEYGGRVRERFRAVVVPVLACAVVASLLLEFVRGWHRAYGASATMFGLTLVGAGLGGWLYVLQLAHVRALVGRTVDPAGPAVHRSDSAFRRNSVN